MLFHSLNIATIPVNLGEKTPALTHWKQYQTQLPTEREILHWHAKTSNVGIVCGWRNLVVIDFDDLDLTQTYGKWLLWAARHSRFSITQQVLRSAYKVRTARGIHVYVFTRQIEPNRKLTGLDIKARNGYVLGEGSIHPSGALYTALTPGLMIPTVNTLSEVLPPAVLLTTELPPVVKSIVTPITASDDPWAYVDAPIITSNLIDRIKGRLRLPDLIDLTGARRTGAHHYLLACPLHQDDNPSFWIDTHLDLCGCFAGCTPKPLDVINLYARLYGLSNQEAIFTLARLL